MDKYRKGVGIFLINTKGKLWVGKRIDFKNDFWQMPQGGIDNNESPKEAMKRELMEEVGIFKKYRVLRESEKWLKKNFNKTDSKLILNIYSDYIKNNYKSNCSITIKK